MLSEGGPSLTVLVPYRKSKRHVLARIAQGLVEFPGFILLAFCASGRCTTTARGDHSHDMHETCYDPQKYDSG